MIVLIHLLACSYIVLLFLGNVLYNITSILDFEHNIKPLSK